MNQPSSETLPVQSPMSEPSSSVPSSSVPEVVQKTGDVKVPSTLVGKLKQRFSNLPKSMKLIVCLGGILLVLLLLSSASKKPDATPTTPPPPPTLTPLPVVTSGPTFTPVPTAKVTPPITNWTTYPNGGKLFDYGMTITYPFGWTVKYKANTTVSNATKVVDFDFLPAYMTPNASASGNMGWGGMTVYLYYSINSLDTWLKKFAPAYIDNYDQVPPTDIPPGGDTQVQDIIPKSGDLPILYVTSGNNYYYRFVFSSYGVPGFSATLHSTIFPKMRIN